ncbi:MAG: NUDIX domain-containing protein [Defluviitaleaceae bacterium]|nr:NUDIX domain-containing protein [Defluviitaleaceae bacterium]
MVNLRNSVTAFLYNGENVLLIKRSASKLIAPNIWSGVGGHIEPHEINNPIQACYREIYEETGIPQTAITSLELKYIILRRYKNEIRQNYIYFGHTSQVNLCQTCEGTLYWVPKNELTSKEYTQSFAAMLDHYVNTNKDDAVYVGVTQNNEGKLKMCWSRCEDFEH